MSTSVSIHCRSGTSTVMFLVSSLILPCAVKNILLTLKGFKYGFEVAVVPEAQVLTIAHATHRETEDAEDGGKSAKRNGLFFSRADFHEGVLQ